MQPAKRLGCIIVYLICIYLFHFALWTVSGNKKQLIVRVAEGRVLGAIPRCPKCSGGKPSFDSSTGLYKCRGYFDDDQYVPCSWLANMMVIFSSSFSLPFRFFPNRLSAV